MVSAIMPSTVYEASLLMMPEASKRIGLSSLQSLPPSTAPNSANGVLNPAMTGFVFPILVK